jgi:DNA-damage-inducible protein J
MRYNKQKRKRVIMPKTTMNLRIDASLKKEAEKVVDGLGLSMASAITLYLKALVREKGIPFAVTLEGKKKPSSPHPSIDVREIEPDDDGLLDEESIKAAIAKF